MSYHLTLSNDYLLGHYRMIVRVIIFALMFCSSAHSMSNSRFITLPDAQVLTNRLERAGFKEFCIKSKLPEQLGDKTLNPSSIPVLIGGLCNENPRLPMARLDFLILAANDFQELPPFRPYSFQEKQHIAMLVLQDFPDVIEQLRSDNLLDDEL